MNGEKQAKFIIETLVRLGVKDFCLSPGSRSTLLALAVADHKEIHSTVHFDERGMAFYALGIAKATKRAVAMIVTSGTAVANLFPAILEASLSHLPLLVLTADRPSELRDCGANQTIDQVKIYGNHVKWQVDLPCASSEITETYLASTLAYAVSICRRAPEGPVHLNCMFREPFFGSMELPDSLPKAAPCYFESENLPAEKTLQECATLLSSYKRGAILVGAQSSSYPLDAIFSLGERLKWPVFSDPLSGLRSTGKALSYLQKSLLKQKPDAILHLGDRRVTEQAIRSNVYMLVADHSIRHDPHAQVTHRVEMDPVLFCKQLLPHVSVKPSDDWLDEWNSEAHAISQEHNHFFASSSTLSEPEVARTLASDLPKDWALFVSNSMPIRDIDQFYYPKQEAGPIFANRGVSGIDGNIATACGIASGSNRPCVALLGDLACLHDLNSFALVKKSKQPMILIILNNGGGAIFSFLPVQKKREHFEEFFAAAHTLDFKHAASLFHLDYLCVKTQADWKESFAKAVEMGRSMILEVCTDRNENFRLHEQIKELEITVQKKREDFNHPFASAH